MRLKCCVPRMLIKFITTFHMASILRVESYRRCGIGVESSSFDVLRRNLLHISSSSMFAP